uniref:Fibrinogen C-terminal domain-containing protein n=2 Tax=Amphimedon queenslandica TaxID=400682 RepID=A0A1X7UHD9_AMPQE
MEEKEKYEDMSSAPMQSQENPYEMVDFNINARRDHSAGAQSTEVAIKNKVSKQSTWSTPLVVIAVLLCLIVFLLVVILCLLLVLLSAKDATSTSSTATTGAIAGAGSFVPPNFTEWANDVVSKVNQTLPDFDQWANGVVSKVNSNVTQSLPDFNQWANGVVSKVNSNVTQSLPDFNQWANGVISKVNQTLPDFDQWANGVVSKVNRTLPDFDQWANGVVSKVNQTLPDFDQWANGVVSKVNSNVTQSFPDFNQWANGVVSKVNSNVTKSLPDFDQWANGVISKVNSNVTQSLPDFNQWANGVVSKVNSNVTESLPNFDQWANGVVSKVNSNVTESLPDFDQWANGVVSKVNSNVTQSFPDFDQWANGVVSKVNSNVTESLPDFDQWANGVVSKVNSNVTQSFPDFDQWANGVVSEVNQTLPDFDQWANGVVSKVNQTLPNFNQWANGVAQNTFELLQSSPNFTELNEQILQTTTDSAQKLIDIVNTLSNLEDTSISTAGVADDILLIAQELLVLHNDSTALPTSCKEIKERQPLSPSGLYLLANTTATYTTYCNMEELCGSGGGWTRLAYLDMTDSTENCPSEFRLYQSGGVRACGRTTSSGGSCTSVQFPSNGISYSQVCGRVVGYQYGSTDANPHENNINSHYVDGVSITRGSPRQHVWTLMAGLHEATTHAGGFYNCPCSQDGSQDPVLPFIGNDYFCESGNPATDGWQEILYASDPLWDGKGCGSLEGNCCNATGLPWFNKVLGTTTTDYLELRVCGDEGTAGEDAPVSFYELYAK